MQSLEQLLERRDELAQEMIEASGPVLRELESEMFEIEEQIEALGGEQDDVQN